MDWAGFLKELLGAFNQIWKEAHSPRAYAEKREKEFKKREQRYNEISQIEDPEEFRKTLLEWLNSM